MLQPNRHRVEIATLPSGEQIPLIIKPDGMPAPMTNWWILELRRAVVKARQFQTLENYAYALARFEDYLAARRIDIVQRHESGKPFVRSDGTNLGHALSKLSPEAAARRQLADGKHALRFRLGQTKRIPEIRKSEFVCGETRTQRAVIVHRYLRDLAELLEKSDPDRWRDHTSPFAGLALALKVATDSVKQPGREALDDALVREIFLTLEPSTPEKKNERNPFSAAVQLRNFVIILLLSGTALRISELLALKLEDINLDPRAPELSVVRRPDDPDDKKRRKTQAKTEERTIAIPEVVAAMLATWIYEHRTDRKRFGDATDCPFVFLAFDDPAPAKARQLSRSGADKMFRTLREGEPDTFGPEVTAHRFRHSWVTKTWMKRLENGQDDPFFDELVAYHLGWKDHSQQARAYAKVAIQEHTKKFTLDWQNHITELMGIAGEKHTR